MKLLTLILIVAGNMILLAEAPTDDTDGSPYSDIISETLNHAHAPLTLTAKTFQGPNSVRVNVTITLYNNTDKNIIVIESHIFSDFQFEIKDDLGAIVSGNQLLKKTENHEQSMHADQSLSPGQSRRYDLNLAKIYDFKSGKTYTIRVSRFIRSEQGFNWNKITSNTVKVTIP